ncbi:MAG: exodeoxyribonuclease VII small subunit [Luteolibacter sp.]|jgi:exodeoxyribonuclease VII small subunit
MAPRTRKSLPDGRSEDRPTFEQALGELEAIVEQMENEQLPLNELIDQYENGVRLFTACDKLLGEARERLELITLKARQDPTTTPAPSVDSDSGENGEPDDDDIRLF